MAPKSRLPPGQIFSQPANTGSGAHDNTQLAIAISALRSEKNPVSLDDFAIRHGLQSLVTNPALLARFKAHERVLHNDKNNTWMYKPDFDLRSPQDVLNLLQQRYETANPGRASAGLKISELRESYPAAKDAVEEFAKHEPREDRKLLVVRNLKDQSIRHVYWNEIRGEECRDVDQEFKTLWNELKVPDAVDLPKQLEQEGFTTMTSSEAAAAAAAAASSAVRGAPRGRGRGRGRGAGRKVVIRNQHAGIDLSKDYGS